MRWRHVDATLDRPVFKQIADTLRADIEAGRLRPGDWLPSEAHMGGEFNAGRNSIRSALRVLTGEGLLVSRAGKGHQVRDTTARAAVKEVGPGVRITARMPSDAERRDLGLIEGTPILVVESTAGVELLPGDRYAIETVEGNEGAPRDA
jgi:DNA-binding GntR family transcriptional regulator